MITTSQGCFHLTSLRRRQSNEKQQNAGPQNTRPNSHQHGFFASLTSQLFAQSAPVSCPLAVPNPTIPASYNDSGDPSWTQTNKMPRYKKFRVGPTIYTILANPSTYTGVAAAIDNAAQQWNAQMNYRDFGRNTSAGPTGSDCPSGQPFQLGAFNFGDSQYANCASLNRLKISHGAQYVVDYVIGYADYNTFPECTGTNVSNMQCGTKSVTLNLARAFTTSQTPLPGIYDLQSVLVHEFGHSLGLGHMDHTGTCETFVSTSCSQVGTPSEPTAMQNEVKAGEICRRTLKGPYGDTSSIRDLYPEPN